MLVPREMKLEHSGGVKAMTDEQIERSIELIKEMLAQREAGANAKVIYGEVLDAAALPAPETTGAEPHVVLVDRRTSPDLIPANPLAPGPPAAAA